MTQPCCDLTFRGRVILSCRGGTRGLHRFFDSALTFAAKKGVPLICGVEATAEGWQAVRSATGLRMLRARGCGFIACSGRQVERDSMLESPRLGQ